MRKYSKKEICEIIDDRLGYWVKKEEEVATEFIKGDELRTKVMNAVLAVEKGLIEKVKVLEATINKMILGKGRKMNYHITLQKTKWVEGKGDVQGEPLRVASFVREFDRDTCKEALDDVYPYDGYEFESVDGD